MTKNWNRAAMRFESARYLHRQKMLEVKFANGDSFLVAAESILPGLNGAPFGQSGVRAASQAATLSSPEWDNLRVSETGDVLEVPILDTVIEIPWDRIRAVADPEFRAHLADHASERARLLGERIRALRLQSSLTRAKLADKIGVARELISDLEAGKLDPPADLIEGIMIALGKGLRDLTAE